MGHRRSLSKQKGRRTVAGSGFPRFSICLSTLSGFERGFICIDALDEFPTMRWARLWKSLLEYSALSGNAQTHCYSLPKDLRLERKWRTIFPGELIWL